MVFRDFCLERGIDFITFCLEQGILILKQEASTLKFLKMVQKADSVPFFVGADA